MSSIARFTISGTDYDYYVDEFDFRETEIRGTQYILGDDSVSQDVQDVMIRLVTRAVWDQASGPATSAGELWRKALAGNVATIKPDTGRSFTIDMYADMNRPPSTWYRTRKGIVQRGQALHWVSANVYQPGDQKLIDLASYQDSLQSQ